MGGSYDEVLLYCIGFSSHSLAKESVLTCNRDNSRQGYCKVVESHILWSTEEKIPLRKLQGAKVKSNGNGDNLSHQVLLLTNRGKFPFTSNTILHDGKQKQSETASRISSFIKDEKQTSLNIHQNDRWWGFMGIVSLGIGVLPLLKQN
ncbi:MAG: hypothetical protein HC908_12455 [Calothrix sp. SM1_7_51]|nr:hypothetical protein [Calothrix sp. SM1_7_51]